jgi:hypothetical protein
MPRAGSTQRGEGRAASETAGMPGEGAANTQRASGATHIQGKESVVGVSKEMPQPEQQLSRSQSSKRHPSMGGRVGRRATTQREGEGKGVLTTPKGKLDELLAHL